MNDNLNLKEIFAQLAAPFHPNDLEWRAGATNSEKTKALALAYITSRAVMDRLDETIGPENWRDEYKPGPDGGVICGLSLRINGEWITKWDGADNTDFEAIKGGLSDAFKRAGYKWGVGRYLYRLESSWVNCEAHGKSISLKSTPTLPAWALPQELKNKAQSKPVVQPEVTAQLQTVTAPSTNEKTAPNGNGAKPFTSSDRETQILNELGFEVKPTGSENKSVVQPNPHKPVVLPVAPAIKTVVAPVITGNTGNIGNISSPKPVVQRAASWSADTVLAVVDHHLAKNAGEAVTLLNQTGLSGKTSPQDAVAEIKKMLGK